MQPLFTARFASEVLHDRAVSALRHGLPVIAQGKGQPFFLGLCAFAVGHRPCACIASAGDEAPVRCSQTNGIDLARKDLLRHFIRKTSLADEMSHREKRRTPDSAAFCQCKKGLFTEIRAKLYGVHACRQRRRLSSKEQVTAPFAQSPVRYERRVLPMRAYCWAFMVRA